MRVCKPVVYVAAFFFLLTGSAAGQLSVSGQLRTRTELRDGQGAPLSKGEKPAAFTSQRTRLNIHFNNYRVRFGLSLQDVRVWGQDGSMINRTTAQDFNSLMLHEAWTEIALSDTADRDRTFTLKLGRQELIYDDQRLLGNLDWLQQGRRHDVALFRYELPRYSVQLAAAFNQNREKNSGTIYNNIPPGNYASSTNAGPMYKSMEFFYIKRKLKSGAATFLFLSDQFNAYTIQSVDNIPVKTFTEETWARATTGMYYTDKIGRTSITASAYYQFGKNGNGMKTDAHLLSLSTSIALGKWSAGPGIDYTSKGFDPLYGTPHKFWGLMDYFYAASPSGQFGLVDYYIRSSWKANARTSVIADAHYFTAATAVPGFDRNYGQEIDIVALHNITKMISIEAGYGHFFTKDALSSPAVKNISNARKGANWAYVMINVRPEFLLK